MSRIRVKKSPSYAELQRRNRNQAEHIQALAREYRERYRGLSAERVILESYGATVDAEKGRLHGRYAWGFWRRLRFAVTGR